MLRQYHWLSIIKKKAQYSKELNIFLTTGQNISRSEVKVKFLQILELEEQRENFMRSKFTRDKDFEHSKLQYVVFHRSVMEEISNLFRINRRDMRSVTANTDFVSSVMSGYKSRSDLLALLKVR